MEFADWYRLSVTLLATVGLALFGFFNYNLYELFTCLIQTAGGEVRLVMDKFNSTKDAAGG